MHLFLIRCIAEHLLPEDAKRGKKEFEAIGRRRIDGAFSWFEQERVGVCPQDGSGRGGGACRSWPPELRQTTKPLWTVAPKAGPPAR